MKTLILICLCVTALCRPVAAVPHSLASREVLRDMPGEVPRLLGEAIDQESIKDIRTHASALIRSGNAKLVVNLLSYPSDDVHRGAIEALVETNCREALPALLDYLWELQFLAVLGGTEAQGEPHETFFMCLCLPGRFPEQFRFTGPFAAPQFTLTFSVAAPQTRFHARLPSRHQSTSTPARGK